MLDTWNIMSIAARKVNENGVRQADRTFCEHEMSLVAMSDAIVYTSHFVRLAGRRRTEGHELDTTRATSSNNRSGSQAIVGAEGVLQSHRVVPILKRDFIPPFEGSSVDVETERESESKEQTG